MVGLATPADSRRCPVADLGLGIGVVGDAGILLGVAGSALLDIAGEDPRDVGRLAFLPSSIFSLLWLILVARLDLRGFEAVEAEAGRLKPIGVVALFFLCGTLLAGASFLPLM